MKRMKRMKRLSFQWRITLLTAILIAGTCICLNLLLYRSGTVSMDSLNGFVMKYDPGNSDVVKIEFDDQQMSAFLHQFSQEVYDAKAAFGKKGWCITAVVTLCGNCVFCKRQSTQTVEAIFTADRKHQSGQSYQHTS